MTKRRRPKVITKRACILLVLLLLGGAIITVAVAWGCVAIASEREHVLSEAQAELSLSRWTSLDRSAYGNTVLQGSRVESFGWRRDSLNLNQFNNGSAWDGRSLLLFTVHCGWPAHSMQAAAGGNSPAISKGWVPLPPVLRRSGPSDMRCLASTLIWPGFAINTVFYAAILWLVFVAPFAFRRRRRIKRGLCPKCAYPVGASDVCTECGEALSSRV